MKLTKIQINRLRKSSDVRPLLAGWGVAKRLLEAPDSRLSNDDMDTLHDALTDIFVNDAPVIEEFTGNGGAGRFPIQIRGFPGGYFVNAQEFDNVGFFDDLREARNRLHSDFGEYLVSHDEDDDEHNEPVCPSCGSTDDCPHLLLVVDKTFRSAEGGILYKAFNDRWAAICEEHEEDPGFEEQEPFDELLLEVDSLASSMMEYDFEGGPGASSSMEIYYTSSPQEGKKALKRFTGKAK